MNLRVLLIDARQTETSRLAATLAACGFQVVAALREPEEILTAASRLEPDAIVVDTEAPRPDTLTLLAELARRQARPMLMLSELGDADLTRAAADAGASAYVVPCPSPETLRSLLQMAIMHFRGQSALQAELGRIRRELEDRRQIDRAKCRLMEHYGLSEHESYERLRRLAMTRGQRLADLARMMLASPGLA